MDEKSVFNKARKIADSDVRDEYLRMACGDDVATLERIRGLLAANDDESNFMEQPPADLLATQLFSAEVESRVGQQIGPYKLLQEIGEGGMGSVFMAEQEEPVRRRVAIKIIRPGKVDKQFIARFEAERQALAMMDHQNIAKVLDAGQAEDGSPYLVMELIQGVSITHYCDRHKLTPRERLALFVPICKAIQHAHQKGIIHRDLKPSNVLVCIQDGNPVPKIIDFGLAKPIHHQLKLTDKTMFTEFGQVLGTFQYMSPEQAVLDTLDVDTRSDVYSLGVLLYELLSGTTPIEKETIKQNALLKVLEIIREQDPPRPSSRLSSSNKKLSTITEQRKIQPVKLEQILRDELDWVVMKALEKDRTRRYETAKDFAEDISRYLNGDAVIARPPSWLYRTSKFIRRYRVGFAVATSIALATLIIACVAIWVVQRNKSLNLQARLETMVDSLQSKRGVILPPLENLEAFPKEKVLSELEQQFEEADDIQKLPLAYALAHFGDARLSFLVSQIRDVPVEETENLLNAFKESRAEAIELIQNEIDKASREEAWNYKAFLATLMLHLDRSEWLLTMCQLEDDCTERTHLIHFLSKWTGNWSSIRQLASSSDNVALRSAIILGLGQVPTSRFPESERDEWIALIRRWHQTESNALIHSATGWLMAQWNVVPPELPVSLQRGRNQWWTNSIGITLISVPPGDFVRESREAIDPTNNQTVPATKLVQGEGNPISQTVNITKRFSLSDREITRAQFQQFIDDPNYDAKLKPVDWKGADEKSPSIYHPAHRVSWEDAVLFCNWLSHREKLMPCYQRTGEIFKLGSREYEKWKTDLDANGYRLPTEAEWEHACRAGTKTDFSYGNDETLLEQYAHFRKQRLGLPGTKRPNHWGFFDMHGNVWEWCSDLHGMYSRSQTVDDPAGPDEGGKGNPGQMRVMRGGDFWSLEAKLLRSDHRFAFPMNYRRFNNGFRICRND